MTPAMEQVLSNQIANLDKQIEKFGSNAESIYLKSIAESLFMITLLLAQIAEK